jgi:outer membrane protein
MSRDAVDGRATVRWVRAAIPVLALGALIGCAQHPPSVYGVPGASPAPNVPWVPPPRALRVPAPSAPSAAIPESLLAASARWGLNDLIDVALRRSSQTQAAWAQALAAAAAYGSERGGYLPDVTLNANAVRQKGAVVPGGAVAVQETYGGSANLSWLLFNFGGRRASVDETRQALIAADWTHNAVIQNVVLQVEEAYYQYVTARALLAAEESTRVEVQVGLASAEARHRAGVATIGDVLQARTALSQVQLAVQSLKGEIAVTRGALATSMGLPANLDFEVEPPPLDLPVQRVSEDVDEYLDRARASRPDLAAARAQYAQSEAHVRKVRAEGFPSFSAFGSLGRSYREDPYRSNPTYSASLQMTFPIFTGFSHEYDLFQSKAQAAAARAQLQTQEQLVVLEVWTSYYDFETAEQQLSAAGDLLRSATQSREVALGRYQAGAGSILDLLSAQAALESARATLVQARAGWLTSLARLAHDTGALGPGKESTR